MSSDRHIFFLKRLLILYGTFQRASERRTKHATHSSAADRAETAVALELKGLATPLMALGDYHGPVRQKAIDLPFSKWNPDGNRPAFEGDDPRRTPGQHRVAVIAIRFVQSSPSPT
jgi:hypothetical protein